MRMVQLKFAADLTPRRRRRTFSVVRLQRLIPSSQLHRPEDGHREASRRGFRGSRRWHLPFHLPQSSSAETFTSVSADKASCSDRDGDGRGAV